MHGPKSLLLPYLEVLSFLASSHDGTLLGVPTVMSRLHTDSGGLGSRLKQIPSFLLLILQLYVQNRRVN